MMQLDLFPLTPEVPVVQNGLVIPMSDYRFSEVRVRTKIHPDDLERKKGKILAPSDLDMMLTGPTAVYLPNGQLMAKYLPGALSHPTLVDQTLGTLQELGRMVTDNRGMASGFERVKTKSTASRTRTPPVASSIIGSFDPNPPFRYCRLTAWSGRETEKYEGLFPLFQTINRYFKNYVPDRYAVQEGFAERTHEDWRIAGTAFTTVTVNRSYPTGVHTDAGDLESGFSNLAVFRKGSYSGGIFTFPEFRLGVDMQHGDLLLMDAHQWHGNTYMECRICGEGMGSPAVYPSHDECGTERISVVAYYRSKMTECGSAAEEIEKARDWAEHRIDLQAQGLNDVQILQQKALEDMALEALGG
jgi:hypothetical protein